MNPLTLTVESVHSINTERGVVGVVTMTGDIETIRAIGGLLLRDVIVTLAEPKPADPKPAAALPTCTLCKGPISPDAETMTGTAWGPRGAILLEGEVAHGSCYLDVRNAS